jgi:hypothetical protein
MTDTSENQIAKLISEAEEVVDVSADDVSSTKPRLLVDSANPDQSVAMLRDILSSTADLYDRGVPVRLAHDQIRGGTVAQIVTPDTLVMTAHSVCRPYAQKVNRDGSLFEVDVRLPRNLAVMYLDWRGEWNLPPLNGIASAPMLTDDGAIQSADGYDRDTGMWRENVPDLTPLIPEHPTDDDAVAALRLIRETFKTFCFADAETIVDEKCGLELVDTDKAPGRDETGFLVSLLTAVCRPSLHLAPGVLLKAAPMSGAGAGKGLLARCISIIAFGHEPHAVTGGSGNDELEKRIASELIEGSPVLFLDNLNNRAFKSDLLASAITERPARVRVLGRSQMVPLNATSFVIMTGNGLSVSEDLARRFIAVELDPRTEDPEARRFDVDIRREVMKRRPELLAAVLTIWRWGRLSNNLVSGRALGSFEQWCQWVRDPLLTLGCKDPAERVSEAKERDERRQLTAELFNAWWACHKDRPTAIRDLDEDVRQALDPQGRGRQFQSSQLAKLAGTRIGGFLLTRQPAPGKWGVATYAMSQTAKREEHRDHRGHRPEERPSVAPSTPDGPYAPYADTEQSDELRTNEVPTSEIDDTAKPVSEVVEPDQGAATRWRVRL